MFQSSPTIANNTITGNTAEDSGAGLYLDYYSSPALGDNTITGNIAGMFGGGLYVRYSSPTVANNTIMHNSASSGGGAYLRYSSPTIVNNSITLNDAGAGGGLYLYSSAPTIVNNAIIGNSANGVGNDDGDGGGLYLSSSSSSATIANNCIHGNSAEDAGGGLFLDYASPTITNNSIASNIAERGGGLYLMESSSTIANTIVAFNSSGIYRNSTWGIPTLRYNCVYGNLAYDYDGLSPIPSGTDGNISADPSFVRNPDDGGDGWGDDPATPDVDEGANDDFGDLRLSYGSPCIDAGDSDAVPADTPDLDDDGDTAEPMPFDLAGEPRFVDDPATVDTGLSGSTGLPVVDMGAYEFPGDFSGDCDGSGIIDVGDTAMLVACLAGPDAAMAQGCNCADLTHDGTADLADFAEFQERMSGAAR